MDKKIMILSLALIMALSFVESKKHRKKPKKLTGLDYDQTVGPIYDNAENDDETPADDDPDNDDETTPDPGPDDEIKLKNLNENRPEDDDDATTDDNGPENDDAAHDGAADEKGPENDEDTPADDNGPENDNEDTPADVNGPENDNEDLLEDGNGPENDEDNVAHLDPNKCPCPVEPVICASDGVGYTGECNMKCLAPKGTHKVSNGECSHRLYDRRRRRY